jgi:radical SAM/Cys-rich protein
LGFEVVAGLSLLKQHHRLSAANEQLRTLADSSAPSFRSVLKANGLPALRAGKIDILQINVGKVCNQTCRHCHVDAGPDRKESMSLETAQQCLDVLRAVDIGTLDITGGAPEINPHFRMMVEEASALNRHVIDRCNLTILLTAGHRDLPEFLAKHKVEVVASMPCYLEKNVDAQRGEGVYEKSIEAIRKLNAVGYGVEGSGLTLTLVFNPGGASLPPDQKKLEADYRRELAARFGITFTRLFTITNMPISRFLEDLVSAGKLDAYMEKLVGAFNPAAANSLMCLNTLSVGWDGRLYDCDFNQMLEIEVEQSSPRTIADFRRELLEGREIATDRHCFGCTAGAGSSCQGSIA